MLEQAGPRTQTGFHDAAIAFSYAWCMNLRQLTYFVRVVEAGNITHAAESLYVAQSALSQQMALLEDALGVQLLLRSAKGVQATNEGLLLYRHAQTILRQVESTRSILARTASAVAGSVSIALASSTARMLALPLMRAVKQQYPAVVLEIVDIPSANLTQMVQQGRVDFSLSPDQEALANLTSTPLLVEELLLLTHPSTPLPEGRIGIETLAQLPLVLPSAPNKLRTRLDHAFMQARLPCKLFAQASTAAILVPAVCAGLAATILPYSAAHVEIESGSIVLRHLEIAASREISLCVSRSMPVTPAVASVIEVVHSVVHALIEDGTWRYCRAA